MTNREQNNNAIVSVSVILLFIGTLFEEHEQFLFYSINYSISTLGAFASKEM